MNIFRKGSSRDNILRRNIVFTAILKVVGIVISFLLVPITIDYLDTEQYGIWLTLSSILLWFAFFDIGLGSGMRTYLTEAISLKDYSKARMYLTTTLVLMSIISIILGVVFIFGSVFLDLNKLFNTTSLENNELRTIFFIAIIGTLFMFVLKNVGLIYVALQRYAVNELLIVLGNFIALVLIFILMQTDYHSLLYIVLIFILSPILVYLFAGVFVFCQNRELRPTLHSFDMQYGRRVLSKGLGFFFIQITSCLVIYGGSNFFITQYIGPESVTTYNIAYKYFSVLVILYTVIISPLWSVYTDAFVKNDFSWIRRNFNKSLIVWGATVVVGLLLLLLSNIFYELWVGSSVEVPLSISISVLAYVSFFNLNNCVTYLLNSTNKIFVQILSSIIITLLYIICIISLGVSVSVESIVWCMALSYVIMSCIHLYQCRLIINKKAKGIWNR